MLQRSMLVYCHSLKYFDIILTILFFSRAFKICNWKICSLHSTWFGELEILAISSVTAVNTR